MNSDIPDLSQELSKMKWSKIISIKSVLLVLILAAAVFAVPATAEETNSGYDIDAVRNGLIEGVMLTDLTETERNTLISVITEKTSAMEGASEAEQIQLMSEIRDAILSICGTSVPDTESPIVSLRWANNQNGDVHGDLAFIAANKEGVSQVYAEILRANAWVPDTWAFSYDHYVTTGALDNAQTYANNARISMNSDPTYAYTQLAYSMHFMSDIGCPVHYSYLELIHHAFYETYVADNWLSGQNYKYSVNNSNNYAYISNVYDAGNALSDAGGPGRGYILARMLLPAWGEDQTFVDYTKYILKETMGYNRGLIDYALS